jgi:hypothetical protein
MEKNTTLSYSATAPEVEKYLGIGSKKYLGIGSKKVPWHRDHPFLPQEPESFLGHESS